jgi:hypothetical protein
MQAKQNRLTMPSAVGSNQLPFSGRVLAHTVNSMTQLQTVSSDLTRIGEPR